MSLHSSFLYTCRFLVPYVVCIFGNYKMVSCHVILHIWPNTKFGLLASVSEAEDTELLLRYCGPNLKQSTKIWELLRLN